MKGESQVIWIVVFLIMALIVLVIISITLIKGKDTADVTYSQTDLIACCDNCKNTLKIGETISDVQCPTGQETVSLSELFENQGYTGSDLDCNDIPFCR